MPGYNCSIKERMLYSASKSGVVEVLEQSGIEILKKVSALLQTSYSKISFRPVVFHLFSEITLFNNFHIQITLFIVFKITLNVNEMLEIWQKLKCLNS